MIERVRHSPPIPRSPLPVLSLYFVSVFSLNPLVHARPTRASETCATTTAGTAGTESGITRAESGAARSTVTESGAARSAEDAPQEARDT